MNDSVLRGFCQKCNAPVQAMLEEGVHVDAVLKFFNHKPIPVWFLSPQQMRILISSNKWHEWCHERKGDSLAIASLDVALSRDPFLVASILKESEKQ